MNAATKLAAFALVLAAAFAGGAGLGAAVGPEPPGDAPGRTEQVPPAHGGAHESGTGDTGAHDG